MTRPIRPGAGDRRHLELSQVLDFLDDRLTPAAAREVEEHLATPCGRCRERVREAALLVGEMRADRVPELPAALRERALAVFAPQRAPARRPGLAERVAALLFDSLVTPAPAAARRAVGDARRMRFGLGEGALELEIEREERALLSLRGRLETVEPALHRIDVMCGSERFSAWPDADGRFALERVPAAPLALSITGPSGRFVILAFEP